MRRTFRNSLIFTTMLFSGCTFSGIDLEEEKVVGSYYIRSLAGKASLVYKEPDAATESVVVAGHIDSIGWNDKVIVCVAGGEYFIIDRKTQSLKKYKDQTLYIDAYNKFGIRCIRSGNSTV